MCQCKNHRPEDPCWEKILELAEKVSKKIDVRPSSQDVKKALEDLSSPKNKVK